MKKIYRAWLAGGSIALAFIIAEIFLRVFIPQTTFTELQSAFTFPCFEKGTYYWLSLQPNAACTLRSTINAFPDVSVRTNSMGLRSAEIQPKDPNVTRILFVGDSYTFGWGVPEELAYPRLVGTFLKEHLPHKTFEIVNAGLPSTGMGRAYLFLKNELEKISPDIVVIGFYPFSDIGYDTVVNTWVGQDARGLPETIESTAAYVGVTGNIRAKSLPLKFKIPLLRNTHVFTLVMDHIFSGDISLNNPTLARYGACLYKKSCKDLDPYRERVQKLLLGMHAILSEKKIPHLIPMIPSEFSVYPDVRFKYGITEPILPWEKGYPTEVFGTFFAQHNIPHLPLRPVFLNHLNEKTYFQLDDHWNRYGHAIAAEAIAKRLSEFMDPQLSSDTQTPAQKKKD